MGFIVLYLGSIALSYFITGSTAFQMARDIGNSGGKFNLDKLSSLSSLVNPERTTSLLQLIVSDKTNAFKTITGNK